MRFSIQNFRAIKSAEFDIDKITLIAGRNWQGKTSLAQACAFVLTGQTMPEGHAKKDVKEIIHRGAKTAWVVVSDENTSATLTYPDTIFSTIGTPPHASRIAAGLESPVNFSKKELSGFLSKLLKTEPKFDDLRKAVTEAGLNGDELNALWRKVSGNDWGWDTMHVKTKEQCAELKGEWRHVTGGESYGCKKAESWMPEGLIPAWCGPGLENEDVEDL